MPLGFIQLFGSMLASQFLCVFYPYWFCQIPKAKLWQKYHNCIQSKKSMHNWIKTNEHRKQILGKISASFEHWDIYCPKLVVPDCSWSFHFAQWGAERPNYESAPSRRDMNERSMRTSDLPFLPATLKSLWLICSDYMETTFQVYLNTLDWISLHRQ